MTYLKVNGIKLRPFEMMVPLDEDEDVDPFDCEESFEDTEDKTEDSE